MNRAILVLLLVFPLTGITQDLSTLLRQAARLESSFQEEEALPKYQAVLRLQPHHITALCKCSDLSCRIGNRQTDNKKKIGYFKAGYAYARAAYDLDSTNGEVNIVMAFSLARIALVQSPKEKVTAAKTIKRYAENAIKYDPRNYKGYHILGRWHYEVSGLNVIERTFARWFFGSLPAASLDEAVAYYEKSRTLEPGFILNYYELARAYRREGKKQEAVGLLRQMDALKDEMYDDRQVRKEGRQLLKDLEN
jgi:tetratricopeptide (TPR) repeat protein